MIGCGIDAGVRSGLLAAACWGLLLAGRAWASADVVGAVQQHRSPGGVIERCVVLARMPGGLYSEEDAQEEAALCAVDFYDGRYAVCPKVFSTSPGTLVYDLAGGPFAGDAARFEGGQCRAGGTVRHGVAKPPVSYKMSVNGRETSATFANSALAYYHFARYFGATAHVPVAVLRSMDVGEHRRRVSERGLALSAGSRPLRMNHAAWQLLRDAQDDPAGYEPRAELFTADGQVYGVLLRPQGERYSEAVNGTRASGWGEGQSRDFQETAPFRALRSDRPLAEAIAQGLAAAQRDPVLARATAADATPAQIAFWMSDLIDITLLDFIFSQQDRVGNIDYVPYWHWVEEGALRRRQAAAERPPADLAPGSPLLLKRTELGDNDAGVRVSYANYTRRTQMLEKLRHYRAAVYQRLMALQRDFAAAGPLYEYVRVTFGLSPREFRQVVANTAAAAGILQASCAGGRLRFDVEPEALLVRGEVQPRVVDCGAR